MRDLRGRGGDRLILQRRHRLLETESTSRLTVSKVKLGELGFFDPWLVLIAQNFHFHSTLRSCNLQPFMMVSGSEGASNSCVCLNSEITMIDNVRLPEA